MLPRRLPDDAGTVPSERSFASGVLQAEEIKHVWIFLLSAAVTKSILCWGPVGVGLSGKQLWLVENVEMLAHLARRRRADRLHQVGFGRFAHQFRATELAE